MSGMVFLLTIQLRPLSYRLLPCTSSLGPLERPSHLPLSDFPLRMERLPGSVCRQCHRPATVLKRTERTIDVRPKKGALKPSLFHREGLSAPARVRPTCPK